MSGPGAERGAAGAAAPRLPPGAVLCGWGRQFAPGRERRAEDLERASAAAVLFRGLGRSYGDSSLPPASHPEVVATPAADRVLAFDAATGRLRAEAGLSLLELNRLFLPRGFFVPVTPGTQFVTLGGMVAADVHGKNHHVAGTFGEHVARLRLRTGDGRVLECSAAEHADLFLATLGGMGLTGHILEVECTLQRVPSPWLHQESARVPDLDAFVAALHESARSWPFTVGWIDCLKRGAGLGRGILFRGRFAEPEAAARAVPAPRARLRVPFVCPGFLLSSAAVRAFNALHHGLHGARRTRVVAAEAFFYPLDRLLDWNLLYGRRGFTQYQCVLPAEHGLAAARRVIERLASAGAASFLGVIKDCGREGRGVLSFPRPGISLALDLPVRRGTVRLVAELNDIVGADGGRIYLAKDQFTSAAQFRAMEPRLGRFQEIRRRYDPGLRIRSAQSIRLLGDPP